MRQSSFFLECIFICLAPNPGMRRGGAIKLWVASVKAQARTSRHNRVGQGRFTSHRSFLPKPAPQLVT